MISILVTAAYEARTIGKALEAIEKNKLPREYEVLVAAPDVETVRAAQAYGKGKKHVRVFQDEGKGKPSALNLLFARAHGSIFVLTDGDVFVDAHALAPLVRSFDDPSVGVVSGRPVPLNARSSMLGYWAHLLTEVGAHQTREMRARKGKTIVGSGYLMAVRKGLVEKIPENALSDDAVITNIAAMQGCKIGYAPDARVFVQYPTTVRDWMKQKRRSAGGYVQLKALVGKKDEMRSFAKESWGVGRTFAYPRDVREIVWTIVLVGVRLYLWMLIFYDMKIARKGLKELWVRVESTKNGSR